MSNNTIVCFLFFFDDFYSKNYSNTINYIIITTYNNIILYIGLCTKM